MHVAEINRDETTENEIIVTLSTGLCIKYHVKAGWRPTVCIGSAYFTNAEIRSNFSHFDIMKPWMMCFGVVCKRPISALDNEQLSGLSITLATVFDRISHYNSNAEEFHDKTYVTDNKLSRNKLDGDLVLCVDHSSLEMYIMKYGQHVSDVCYVRSDRIEWDERYNTLNSIRCWDGAMGKVLSGDKQRLLLPFYYMIEEIEDMYSMGITDTKSAKC